MITVGKGWGAARSGLEIKKVKSSDLIFHQNIFRARSGGTGVNLFDTGFTLALDISNYDAITVDCDSGLRINTTAAGQCQIGFNVAHETTGISILIGNTGIYWADSETIIAPPKFVGHLCITASIGETVKVYHNGILYKNIGKVIQTQTRALTWAVFQNAAFPNTQYANIVLTKGRLWEGEFTPPAAYQII